MNLNEYLIKENWLKTPIIIEAFQKIKRVDFLPGELQDFAEADEAFPIGLGQTISQPLVVAFMLEQLSPQPGEKILDVGSGSGWTTALLAHIVGEKGKIIGIELLKDIADFGKNNVSKYDFIQKGTVEIVCGDGSKGYKKEAPFDKILCSAAVQKKVPKAWIEQLKIGGKLVTPMGSSIWLFEKKSNESVEETEYPGFTFVPLIEK